ncbi:MAG: MBL fold metallo-hydrolase [Actinomycetota bacterium]
MAFEVVVLGASGTCPAPGAACSGFLLRAGGAELWVDAGPGTFTNLQAVSSFTDLRALVLTHVHLDHVVDVYPLYHWIRFGRTNPGIAGLDVHAPPGAGAHLAQLLTPYGTGTFGEHLVFADIGAGRELRVGPFALTFARTAHPAETYAVRAEAEGRVLVYTADTGPSDDVAALSRGADLLVAEATFQEAVNPAPDVHMTGAEAGALATTAGARRLVLTHIPPGLDKAASARQAAETYAGEVVVAADLMALTV